MMVASINWQENYWNNIEFTKEDIEFLYNNLLEIEAPQSIQEMAASLVDERIRVEEQDFEKKVHFDGKFYFPKDEFAIGEKLIFPALNWMKGEVSLIRDGYNPSEPPFKVLEVKLENGETRKFAANLEKHILNQPIDFKKGAPDFDAKHVLITYGAHLETKLESLLKKNPDFICFADHWFPKALLVDINLGHLNLAEAILDMSGGGPLPTKNILEQVDIKSDINPKLLEFSMNIALFQDERFDEVGPLGEIIWFLKKLEPEWVQQAPIYLRHPIVKVDINQVKDYKKMIDPEVVDELEMEEDSHERQDEIVINIIYPHWRAGTLPLSSIDNHFFPTSQETERIRFNFVDKNDGVKFPGWVVRSSRYVAGLGDWYKNQGVIPGSSIRISRARMDGEVSIKVERRRSNREWIRTALFGVDGKISLQLLKQLVTTSLNDRMSFFISDVKALDKIWEQGSYQKITLEQVIILMMRELIKLNPQGHVHLEELYAAINIIRRCPPSVLLNNMLENRFSQHLGDLYFRLNESN